MISMRPTSCPRVSLLTLLLVLVGCGPPRIDGSSEESIEASVAKVRSSLQATQQAAFDSALAIVAMSGIDIENAFVRLLAGGEAGVVGMEGTVRSRLDGLAAAEVVAMSDSIRLVQLEAAADELELELETYDTERKELAQLELSDPRLDVRTRSFLSLHRLHLTFRNGLGRAIETAYVSAQLISPEREVPWVKESDVYFSFEGGIEPGETRSDSGFLEARWGRVEVPAGAELKVQVQRILFPDGTSIGALSGLLSFGPSTPPSRSRLDQLRQEIERLRNGVRGF